MDKAVVAIVLCVLCVLGAVFGQGSSNCVSQEKCSDCISQPGCIWCAKPVSKKLTE